MTYDPNQQQQYGGQQQQPYGGQYQQPGQQPGQYTAPSATGGASLGDFLRFRSMITPVFIQVIFWVGVAAAVIFALAAIAQGEILSGLVSLILGPVLVRIYAELLILLFRIHDVLLEIRNNTRRM